REVPVYEMSVAKGGLKLQKPGDLSCTEPLRGGPERDGRPFLAINCAKLERTEAGSCVPREQFVGRPERGKKPPCGDSPGLEGPQRRVMDTFGGDMNSIALRLRVGDRPVVDKTGLTGMFNIHLEYTPADAPPADAPDGAPTLFTALGQLGLKLDAA